MGAWMIDSRTTLYGIVGNPVDHSLSPTLHNAAFRYLGINSVYLAFQVERLEDAFLGLKAIGVRGLSITHPFKERVMEWLDRIDPLAERISAVNTVVWEEGLWVGHNTDVYGAVAALKPRIQLSGCHSVIVGAGGAARAIAHGLKEAGAEVIIVNRSEERGRKLAHELGLSFHPLEGLRELSPDLLIHATPVGMESGTRYSLIPTECIKPSMVVMDIVYSRGETPLIKRAAEMGCTTVDGKEMLLHQAARQFELWTGHKAPIGVMKEALERYIGSQKGT